MTIHLPPHALWFQSTDHYKAAISLVNNLYRYEIFDVVTGHRVYEGSAATLAQAKKIVLGMI
jgi:hypothetical protein